MQYFFLQNVNNGNMDKEIFKYLKKQYKKGKSSFAQAMDIFGSRVGVFLGAYFIFFMLSAVC